jgi:hypothetical protein
MLADPDINLTVFTLNEFNSARLIAYEVCDPCEADADGYKIGQTLLSDFVFPSWLETFCAPGTQFDFQKLIKKPLELRPGGYISFTTPAAALPGNKSRKELKSHPHPYDLE